MLNVLVVEDTPEIQRLLCNRLQALPQVRVVGCAADAAQALALAGAHQPGLVTLDVALRGGDRGYSVLRQLGQVCPKARVVVLSSFGWSAMREGFLKAGAHAYFDKAFEFNQALDWIAGEAARDPTPT